MTVTLKFTGKTSCSMVPSPGETAQNMLKALRVCVTRISDTGLFTDADDFSVSQFDGGDWTSLASSSINNLDAGPIDAAPVYWTMHDANAGANAQCYRALNVDGVTYKYVVLDTNSAGYVYTRVYEAWNAVTHVGLNLAYESDSVSYAQRYVANVELFAFASARWLALFSRYQGNVAQSSVSGCFEIEKGDSEEPVGTYPLFAWLNQYKLFGYAMPAQARDVLKDQVYNCFSLPRSVGGSVGYAAASKQMAGSLSNHISTQSVVVQIGCVSNCYDSFPPYGWWKCNGYSAGYYKPAWKRLLEEMLPTGTNPWNTGASNYVFSTYAVDTTPASYHIRGRFHGIKLLANQVGQSGDTISIKSNDAGLYDPQSPGVQHMVVRLSTGGCVAIPLD